MDLLDLIAEVLCRIDLPDREVYPAMARYRDEPGEKTRAELEQTFADCVRRGLDLPREWNFWGKLSDHAAFRKPDRFRELLLEMSADSHPGSSGSSRLHQQLVRAVRCLGLKGDELTILLNQLEHASEEQVARRLMPVFVEVARAQLGIAEDTSVWLALTELPLAKKDESLREFFFSSELLTRVAEASLGHLRLERLRLVAFQIEGLLGDNPRPPRRGGDGGPGVTSPRPPRKPRPSEPRRQQLD